MTKKALCLIFAALFAGIAMTSCKTDNSDDVFGDISDLSYSYETGSLDVEEVKNSGDALFDGDIISDKDIAAAYAGIIVSDTLKKDINNYKTVNVVHDENKGIWSVDFSIDRDTVGGDINIMLSQKTGEVILICFGE